MKGTFVRYDESTGTVFIKANAETKADYDYGAVDSELLKNISRMEITAMRLNRDDLLSPEPKDENYYLIVPEELRRQMSIKPGMAVDFDLVKEGSKEVARIRY
jgi:hypothetical protein